MNKDIICQSCGVVNEFETILTSPPHYAKAVCKICKSFIQWLPNPNGNYKQRCKEQLQRALEKQPDNKFYQSLKVYFDKNGVLTPNQFESINKF
jgi:hypothetical protein